MARTFVGAGRRRQFFPTLMHRAGDLVYHQGYFGVSNDDSAIAINPTSVDRPFVQILDGVWDLPQVFQGANIVNGARIFAAPTHIATSLTLYPGNSIPSGAVAVGRLMATYVNGATYARVVLFGPENQHTAL